MNKTALVISREYFTRVKKKSFLLTTILVPIIIMGFYAAIIAIAVDKDNTERQQIAVIDEAGLFKGKVESKKSTIDFEFIPSETESNFTRKYRQKGYDAFLYVPPFNLDSPNHFILHSPSTISMSTSVAIDRVVNEAIETRRLEAQGIDPKKYKSIAANVTVPNTVDSKEGTKKSFAGVASLVSFACGIMIYMMMLIYGTQVMRGVMEEKTSRIAEVIVSSVRPFQLMMGKIIGIGAVGLTQFAIWILLLFMLQFALPVFMPDATDQLSKVGNAGNMGTASTILQGISSLPLAKILFSFIFYFLGGYLTYASLFAAIGSVVSDDQQDAQQFVFPILMPIILGFVIMSKAIYDPKSSMAVFGSLFPLTSPIVMMGRITSDVPAWQLATSMLLLIGCFFFFTWITSKIYRIGILMYGKKPSWKEMSRWAFRKS